MKKQQALSLAVGALFATACSNEIEMLTYAPAKTGLERGAPLLIIPQQDDFVNRELSETIKRKLDEKNYYRIGVDGGNILGVQNVRTSRENLSRDYYQGHVYDRARITLSGNAVVNNNDAVLYSSTISTSDTGSITDDRIRDYHRIIDFEGFADIVVSEIVPHAYVYEVEIFPVDGNTMLEHAAECCADGEWNEARFLAENSVTVFPNDPEGYYLLGMIARHDRRFDDARAYFAKAADISFAERYSTALTETDIIEHNEALVRKQMNGAPMPK